MQRIQYNSMQPQDIVEHEERRRVNSLLRRERLIQKLGIIDQLSRLLPTADTQESCALQSQVMALPRATPHSRGRRMRRRELGTEHLWWGRMGVCCRQISCWAFRMM